MEIIRGVIPCAKKVVIYGPEGIGKSTFASKFPDPVFIDTEGSTNSMDVARLPKASSWQMLLDQVDYVRTHPTMCKTLVIDTIDWAESMCIRHICDKHRKSGIEDFGYGNGYVYVKEELGKFLNQLTEVVEVGVNVVLTAHAQIRKFEQPDELGAYDRWELKLGKKTASQTSPLIKEWADMLLFANYKTFSIAVDDKGKKRKAQGGERVMYTTHNACWDAKNRYGLPVLQHFPEAQVLGVTATPDRGDMRNLGVYFESLAYEYTLPKAIKEGYLSPIKALTIPLKIDMSNVSVQAGDFKASEIGTALDPYLEGIAQEMQKYCMDKKTVVFLPLVKTSQKFRDLLNAYGFQAAEVNGDSQDRAEVLKDFDAGKYNVLCNSMLLTEGWDCPSVDCIVVLRPTKVRSLYCQMVGRGTRLSPETGKDHLLLLDFLWHTERHELCHPASLICENEEVAQKMTENLEREAGIAIDIEEAEKTASEDVVAQREESLAKQLAEMKKRKKKLVDPLQFEMSIQAEDLSSYVPSFGWEMGPPSDKQKQTLEKLGIMPDQIENAGKAAKILDRLDKRRNEGLTTPKQIRFLEGRGFKHVGTWQFNTAKNLIDRIAGNGWKIPNDIVPQEYKGA